MTVFDVPSVICWIRLLDRVSKIAPLPVKTL